MEHFVFIGFIKASGTMSDGSPWQGYRIAVGVFGRDGNICKVDALKAPCTDSMYSALSAIQPGSTVRCTFTSKGRVVEIVPA